MLLLGPSNISDRFQDITQEKLDEMANFVKAEYGLEIEPTVDALSTFAGSRAVALTLEERAKEEEMFSKALGLAENLTPEQKEEALRKYISACLRLCLDNGVVGLLNKKS